MSRVIYINAGVTPAEREAALRKFDSLMARGYPKMIAASRCGYNKSTVRRWDIERNRKLCQNVSSLKDNSVATV